MIVLNTTNTSLEVVLAGAVTANELQFTIHYEIVSRQGENTVSQSHGVTTGATDATLLAAPTIAGERRLVRSISVYMLIRLQLQYKFIMMMVVRNVLLLK